MTEEEIMTHCSREGSDGSFAARKIEWSTFLAEKTGKTDLESCPATELRRGNTPENPYDRPILYRASTPTPDDERRRMMVEDHADNILQQPVAQERVAEMESGEWF